MATETISFIVVALGSIAALYLAIVKIGQLHYDSKVKIEQMRIKENVVAASQLAEILEKSYEMEKKVDVIEATMDRQEETNEELKFVVKEFRNSLSEVRAFLYSYVHEDILIGKVTSKKEIH